MFEAKVATMSRPGVAAMISSKASVTLLLRWREAVGVGVGGIGQEQQHAAVAERRSLSTSVSLPSTGCWSNL